MAPTLIVLALLALGVGIVAFATRRRPDHPASLSGDQDTAWSEPVAPTDADPFAHAPEVSSEVPSPTQSRPASEPQS
jgi:hypothetical protein